MKVYKTSEGDIVSTYRKVIYSGDYILPTALNEKPLRLGVIAHSLSTGIFFICHKLTKFDCRWYNITNNVSFLQGQKLNNAQVLPAYILDIKTNIQPSLSAMRFSGY